jgi:4-hydroxy-4-methyl-2-oxoglutarate aldolase
MADSGQRPAARSVISAIPMHNTVVPRECLEKLRRFDTCTLANAIERLDVRPRNEGFVVGELRCQFPEMPPVVGYAVTGRIRSSMLPVDGRWYYENTDFWRYVESIPAPRIIALLDTDHVPGFGALFGEVHARICRALDCDAYVTNGAVRDVPGIQNLGFQVFAGNVAVSHAYAHVVEFGTPIQLGGLRICPGDILHGDLHGVQLIPREIVCDLPPLAEECARQEQELFQLCADPKFSVDRLEAKLEQQRLPHKPK